jgi:predicted MarR family transcription regulator
MGLDMYLMAKVYLSEYDDRKEVKEAIEKVKSIASSCGLPESWKPKTVEFEALYWRKVNAIHNWFVQNVQEGVSVRKI